jgi:hypothetical protein
VSGSEIACEFPAVSSLGFLASGCMAIKVLVPLSLPLEFEFGATTAVSSAILDRSGYEVE